MVRKLSWIYRYCLLFVLLADSFAAIAAPLVEPNNGVITSDQTFTYSNNGTSGVQEYWVYIGTGSTGPSSNNILDTGSLGFEEGVISAAENLPVGTIYFTLWYRIDDAWLRDVYEFTVEPPPVSHAMELLAELGCGTNELIRTTSTGWECVLDPILSCPTEVSALIDEYNVSQFTPTTDLQNSCAVFPTVCPPEIICEVFPRFRMSKAGFSIASGLHLLEFLFNTRFVGLVEDDNFYLTETQAFACAQKMGCTNY